MTRPLFLPENSRTVLMTANGVDELPEKRPQFVASFVGTLTAVGVGMTCSWSSSAIPVFQREIGVTTSQEAWIGSILALGGFAGAFPTGPLAHWIGRKRTLQLLMLPLIVSWFLLAYFYHNLSIVYLGRFMAGLSMGGVSVAAPLYVAELAHISIRGTLGTFFQVQITVGLLMTYVFGDLLPDLRSLSLVCAVVPLVFLLSSAFIPESPVYLCEISQMHKAQNSLIWFRGRDYDVEDELLKITDDIKEARLNEAGLSDLVSCKATRKALIISLGLMAFQQLSGINAVLFYTNSIFEKSGAALSPGHCSILVGTVQVVATLASTALIDKSGRKILLILSASIMCISLAALGLYTHAGVTSYTWVPLVSLALFIIAFSLGFGPIPWMLMSELFPPAVKGVASSIAAASNWLLAFVVTNQFNGAKEALGLGPAFLIFSLICGVATGFVILLVPETKGRSVEQVRSLLVGGGGFEEAKETTEKMTTNV
ncbi:unnamed protein product [Ceutorhynchus assimilis]|uniref:Major facilitator superfamily (MFS) profile domain-containing protein n=1 Tax=Ceutorhynchus assimilis TaxID=467358 RepID=A0A9N9MWM4_9CUCU|nr:unnamed protein product [Ceutorhynchus assimilis]